MSAAGDRRREAAREALARARRALYEDGCTGRALPLHTALRRASLAARSAYLQARAHLRYVARSG